MSKISNSRIVKIMLSLLQGNRNTHRKNIPDETAEEITRQVALNGYTATTFPKSKYTPRKETFPKDFDPHKIVYEEQLGYN